MAAGEHAVALTGTTPAILRSALPTTYAGKAFTVTQENTVARPFVHEPFFPVAGVCARALKPAQPRRFVAVPGSYGQ